MSLASLHRQTMRTVKAWRALLIGVGLCLTGAAIAACDQTEPVDQNFDSSLGADFRPPADTVQDAGANDATDAASSTASP